MLGIEIHRVMDGEVTVSFEGREHRVDIEDVNPEDLRDLFGIDFDVKSLLEVETEKTVLIKKKEKLKAGFTYVLQRPAQTLSPDSPQVLSSWLQRHQAEVQQALVVSKAVYQEQPLEYLEAHLKDHNLKSILRSENGDCHFLLAEELDSNRVYLAFRGTEDKKDLTEDLKIYQRGAESGLARGKFHAGFLSRAEEFPLQKLLADKELLRRSLVVCGHSLGGAISAIVTTEILIEREKRAKDQSMGEVVNITFGSPLFGDDTARRFLEEKEFSSKMFHFVADRDPVPSLLSFAQSISAVKNQVDSQIRSLAGTITTLGGQAFYEEKKLLLMATKDQYVNFLATVGPFIEPALDLVSYVNPGKAGAARMFMEGLKLLWDGMDEDKCEEVKRVYIPIGNFLFLSDERKFSKMFTTIEFNRVVEALDILKDAELASSLEAHKLTNYMRTARRNDIFFPNSYPAEQMFPNGDYVTTVPRELQSIDRFHPCVTSAELAAVTGPEVMLLRLVLLGENIFEISLRDCLFEFGFPFGQPGVAVVKRIPMGDRGEKLVVEQAITTTDISVSDHGSNVHLATQFGSCDYLMPRKNIRDIKLQSLSQISKHESIALVIRKSVQRGMAVSQLRGEKSVEEPIVRQILSLTEKALSQADHDRMTTIFTDNTKNIQFILSNKEEYEKVSGLCTRIEDYMRSPLQINAEKSLLKKLSIGALAVLGGGAFAYMAGPGLLVVGAVEALNVGGVAAAGAVGSGVTGFVANRYFTEALADRNYVKVLRWITAELFNVFSLELKEVNPDKVQAVSDLRDDDSIYSNEKAVDLMFNRERGIDNFRGSGLESSTEESKAAVLRRVECIQTVHAIRCTLATQCFIGLVGVQDSGKTSLLNLVWGLQGSTGLFAHTDVPAMHRITSKVSVIDFPGSNSLDYHAKTFSICGAMNNLILVILPFTGDVSDLVSQELAKVFEVMAGSSSSRVVLCINKCGLYLDKLKQELAGQQSPVGFMKDRYVTKLNEHFSSRGIRVDRRHLLFTDWEVDEAGRAFGIEGVEEVRQLIKDYLVELGVISKGEIRNLEAAVSPPSLTQ